MAAAQRVRVEVALGQGLFETGALHLIHVDRSNACKYTLGTLTMSTAVINSLLRYSYCVHYREEKLISDYWTEDVINLGYTMVLQACFQKCWDEFTENSRSLDFDHISKNIILY